MCFLKLMANEQSSAGSMQLDSGYERTNVVENHVYGWSCRQFQQDTRVSITIRKSLLLFFPKFWELITLPASPIPTALHCYYVMRNGLKTRKVMRAEIH